MLDNISLKYKSIGPLLIKMESLVAGTNTGRSPAMKDYYQHCERNIFYALTYMVMNNLQLIDGLISSGSLKSKTGEKQVERTPLLKIQASLSAPEIVTTPIAPELYKMLGKFVKGIIESSKLFHRWQNGTCIITPPQKVAEEEEPYIFSFYSDVISNPAVVQLFTQINHKINKSFSSLAKWLDVWRKYRPLWKVDKGITLEKFAQKKPSVVSYDEKLIFYSKLAKDVESQASFKDVDFIRVISTPLQAAIKSEATGWIYSIGSLNPFPVIFQLTPHIPLQENTCKRTPSREWKASRNSSQDSARTCRKFPRRSTILSLC